MMNKEEAVEYMIKSVLEIEKTEDVGLYKKESDMKKDAVKKILKSLEEVDISEN